MDIATVAGFVIAFGSIILSVVIEGGSFSHYVSLTAFILVIGGTTGAVIINTTMDQLKAVPKVLKKAFFAPKDNPVGVIDQIVRLAEKARREGLLSLEAELESVDDMFMKRGVQLVVDAVDPELVRAILENDLEIMDARHKSGENFFVGLGGFAPTLGILGTVMGLVHMLANLADPSGVSQAIAGAFIATLYGVGIANLVFLPIAGKLGVRSKEEAQIKTMVMEGILSIQAGDNPRIIEEKLKVFLPPTLRLTYETQKEKERVSA
jgi:chemotaxis protein MotA